MKGFRRLLLVVICTAVLSGCRTTSRWYYGPDAIPTVTDKAMTEVRPDRMLVWKAYLSLQVWSVSNAVTQAVTMAEKQDGFVEQKSAQGDESANLTLKIPARAFKPAVASLETLGTVTRRSVQGEDVTEQYIDIEARLKNKVVLRDRLTQLLGRAMDVKDILAIETELNRVQGDIDSMEGRIKSLKNQVNYATVNLELKRAPILGPLGYLFKGIWWGVEKLFVIRE